MACSRSGASAARIKSRLSPESYLVPFKGYADGYNRDRALECLTTRGYTVVDVPYMVDNPSGLPSPVRQP
jgi:hypothetical protein